MRRDIKGACMPEFLDLYVQDLSSKAKWIKEAYSQVGSQLTTKYLKDAFYEYWVSRKLPKASPNEFEILAVDSSSRHYITGNGGIFYVVRALARSLFTIIMDELTIHLDEERRRVLVEVVKSFFKEGSIVSQMIIITHDRELEKSS